jgi:uncharacterized membrane protein
MKRNAWPCVVLVLLCAIYLIFLAATASQLPERVAMHFDATGHANNWIGRAQAMTFFVAMGLGMAAFFVVLGSVMHWMPNWTFNLPHRDYWLAPDRRMATVSFISRQLIWMGCPTVLFFAGIYWLTILANRMTPARLPMELFVPVLGGYLLMVMTWSIIFIRHFSKVPTQRS